MTAEHVSAVVLHRDFPDSEDQPGLQNPREACQPCPHGGGVMKRLRVALVLALATGLLVGAGNARAEQGDSAAGGGTITEKVKIVSALVLMANS
jgi:hypothetical protein